MFLLDNIGSLCPCRRKSYDVSDQDRKQKDKAYVSGRIRTHTIEDDGHETPFSIKVSHLREAARSHGEEDMTLAELSSVLGDEPSNLTCEFILKQKKTIKKHSLDEASHKSIKKSKKSSPLLNIFKRGGRDDKANNNTAAPSGKLFGHPLANVCESDNTPPKTVVDLLTVLFREGPHTTGILRKSANARQCRELKERIDQGDVMDENQAVVVGSVLKEYLRSLPDSLLMEELHDEWVKVSKLQEMEEKLNHVKQLLSQMPACNVCLLKRILCVLHHIQRLADTNKMTSFNLSLCISPSLLWHKDHFDLSSGAPAVEFMIDHCVGLFGQDVLLLLGDPGQFTMRGMVLSMQDTSRHETPFSIKVSHLREAARSRGEEDMTLAELSSVLGDEPSNLKCEFIFKQKKTPKKHSLDEASHKSIKKSKKSSPLLNIFKRGGRDDKANNNTAAPSGKLFGHPLANVCESDNTPPKTVVDLLTVLFREGPHTTGILRKSANARQCRELKERIDQGDVMDENQAVVVGSVLKEYLRSLPDSLLMEELHDEWVKVSKLQEMEEKLNHVKQLLSQMPACNVCLLKRILCVLHHIQRLADTNKMTSFNLSLCISPSLLWHKDHFDLSSGAPAVEFMIDHCVGLFGQDVLLLLGDPGQFKSRQDSGTDSDSMHSVLSMQDTSNGLRCDDSSIDSLVERDLYTGEGEGRESSPKLIKSHLSPSKLSRDSGLTLSDTQLYDDECTDHDHRSAKSYHRSASQYVDRDDYDLEQYNQLDTPVNPVPPPKKQGKRFGGGEGDHAGRLDTGGGIRGQDKRHTLHSSVSSSRLLEHCSHSLNSSLKTDSYRPVLTHPSFSTQVSGEYPQQGMDREEMQKYRKSMDLGMLHKSASGAHLILDDEALPRKYSESGMSIPRQSSGVDSAPPHSPQSKYSYSSRDSVISDSSYGARSRENSVNLAPQTPDDDHEDRLPPWLPIAEMDPPGQHRLALSLNLVPQHSLLASDQGASLSASYHTSQLRFVQNVRYLVSPPASPVYELENQGFGLQMSGVSRQDHAFQPPPPSPWPGKSHEAEDVKFSSSPQIEITQCSSSSDEKLDEPEHGEDSPGAPLSSSSKAFHLEIAHSHSSVSLPTKQMSKYSQSLAKGSPPPRVLLQSLRSPHSGKDPAPVRASHDSGIVAQVQRGGLSPAGETVEMSGGAGNYFSQAFDAARSMETINDAEYIPVKPKLTIIRREESIHSNVSSTSSGSGSSLSKESVSTVALSTSPSAHSTSSSSSADSNSTLSGDHVRPSKPPAYTEALQRNFMLKHNVPIDLEAHTQHEAFERAKTMYEESLQRYLQNRYEQKHTSHAPVTRKISDPGVATGSSSIVVGHMRSESDQPSSADTRIASENVYVNVSRQKHPREVYLESIQRYQEKHVTDIKWKDDGTSEKATFKSVESVSESKAHQRVTDSVGEPKIQLRTMSDFGELRTHRETSEVSERRVTVKRDVRPKSMLEIPFSCLHSDSADRLNKLGVVAPRSCSAARESENSEQKDLDNSAVNRKPRDMSPSPRRNFISEATVFERRDRSDTGPPATTFPPLPVFIILMTLLTVA